MKNPFRYFNSSPEVIRLTVMMYIRYARRAGVVQQDHDFRQRVGQAMAKRYPEKEPSPHIEEQIYEGFASGADQAIMAQFQVTEWDRRAELAGQAP